MVLADQAVTARLAACVQVSGPGESLYRWQGSVAHEQEWYLNLKTLPENITALVDWLSRQHPYELPEIICSEAAATDAYSDWMRDCLNGSGEEG